MPPYRICHLITELQPAGAERALYELARRLDRRRFRVRVVGLRGGLVAEWLARVNVPVTVLGVRGRWDAGKMLALVRLLRDERVDLLHTHLFHADLVGRVAGRLAGVPHLVHTQQVAEMRYRPWQFAWARLTATWCDCIVCCSAGVRDHHSARAHLPRRRYRVIYNGIDPRAYARDPARRRQLREQWGVGPDQVLIACVARLDYQKNVPLLLEAVRRLRQVRQDVRVVIAGDGPERSMLRRLCEETGAGRWVTWLGFTEEIPGVLSAADIFALPSRWEGFGIAAAEAMAAGLPVVATRVPGLTEVVADGLSGLLVDSEDVDALTSALRRLVSDPGLRSRLGAAGVERVNRCFSIQANVSAHERLYEEILAPRQSRCGWRQFG